MVEAHAPSVNDGSDALTYLEKLVEVRLLVLALAFIFYIDIWTVRNRIDPTGATFADLSAYVQSVPAYKVGLFLISFSLIAGALFPALRHIIGVFRVHYTETNRFVREARSSASKRLSDWALALVCISLYDLAVGFFSSDAYRGLAMHLIDFLGDNAFEPTVFRVTGAFFWLACVALALEVDI